MNDIFSAIDPRHALAIVIGASIAVYGLAANLAWLNRQRNTGRLGALVTWTNTSHLARLMGYAIRWLYYLAVPYATLMLGYNTTRALGVWGMDWIAPIPIFTALVLGAGGVALWVWRPYTRQEHPDAGDERGWSWARRIIEVMYQEAHWAFYRSGPILWLGNFYWGSLFGLALAYLAGWSNPQVRANVREITRADAPLWNGSLAIISTLIFLYTQNLWYCLIAHTLLDLGLRNAIGFPRASTPDLFSRDG